MTKLGQDFIMWSGDHKNLTVTVTNAETGGSADLTGGSVVWVLAESPTGGSLVKLTNDSGSGVTVSGSTFTVSLSPIHTSGLSGTYYHEAQVIDANNNVSTVTVGAAKINYDVAG